MLTADPTCAALTLVGALFDGLTANGSGRVAHEANRSCSYKPKLAVHTSTLWYAVAASFDAWLASAPVYSWLYGLTLVLPRLKCVPNLRRYRQKTKS